MLPAPPDLVSRTNRLSDQVGGRRQAQWQSTCLWAPSTCGSSVVCSASEAASTTFSTTGGKKYSTAGAFGSIQHKFGAQASDSAHATCDQQHVDVVGRVRELDHDNPRGWL